jgi:hypothetical protein
MLKKEAALTMVLVQVLTYLSARYAIQLDNETATTIAAGFGALGLLVVRQLVYSSATVGKLLAAAKKEIDTATANGDAK